MNYAREKEIVSTKVRQSRWKDRRKRHAAKEARNLAFRTWRKGRQGHEPQASHCYRTLGSPEKGRQSAAEKGRLKSCDAGQGFHYLV
jgi:hypothetical protein